MTAATAGLTIAAAISSWQALARHGALDSGSPGTLVVALELAWWWAWIPFLPVIRRLADRVTPRIVGWPRALATQLFAGAAVVLALLAVTAPLLVWAEGLRLGVGIWARAWYTSALFSFDLALLVYGILVASVWASERLGANVTASGPRPARWAAAEPVEPAPTVIRVRIGSRSRFVPIDEIAWVEAADYCALLHTDDAEWTVRRSLQELEKELPEERFIRVHRSAIVARDRVRELRREGSAGLAVLHDGTRVPVARSRFSEVRRRLEAARV